MSALESSATLRFRTGRVMAGREGRSEASRLQTLRRRGIRQTKDFADIVALAGDFLRAGHGPGDFGIDEFAVTRAQPAGRGGDGARCHVQRAGYSRVIARVGLSAEKGFEVLEELLLPLATIILLKMPNNLIVEM